MARSLVVLTLLVGAAACASRTPTAGPPLPPRPPFEQRLAWILRLEDRRILREPAPVVAAVPPGIAPSLGSATPRTTAPPPAIAFVPDLVDLLQDPDARIRRRAALAIGRTGVGDGVAPLVASLSDPEPEVRQMAAFALGLLGDARSREPLVAALADPAFSVQASAAQALALLGDASAADAIGRHAQQLVRGDAVLSDEVDDRRDTPEAALRQAVYALAALKAYDPLAAVVLDGTGAPRFASWPVANAIQRIADARAAAPLRALLRAPHAYTRAFAAKGLGALKDRTAVPQLIAQVEQADVFPAVEAIRALGRIGDSAASGTLFNIILAAQPNPTLRLESVAALGGVGGDAAADLLLDLFSDGDRSVRAAAIGALAELDPDGFVAVLSGVEGDREWTVRATMARALGSLPTAAGLPRLRTMLDDSDQRVVPAVLDALVRQRAPEAVSVLLERLKADDPVVRAAAARGLGVLKSSQGAAALVQAYEAGQRDVTYIARAAALTAAAAYGSEIASPLLTKALDDREWAVRVRAAALLKQIDPASDASARIRPVPSSSSPGQGFDYAALDLVAPSVSVQAYLDTDRGTIQIELAMLDAPLTVHNFITLAKRGFFDGLSIHRVVPDYVIQTGDPRGDSEGGPSYTIRDELNERAYLRGAVGMALDWADTGGSQFFITQSPQPQLDAKYTVFGRVVSGMEVVDRVQAGDVLRKVRIWDGVQP